MLDPARLLASPLVRGVRRRLRIRERGPAADEPSRDTGRRWRPPGSLKLRLTVGFTAVAVIVLAVSGSVFRRDSETTARQIAERQSSRLARFLASALAEPVRARDRLQVHVLAKALLDDEDVRSIRIEGSGGEVLFESPTHADVSDEVPGGLVTLAAPVRFAGEHVGFAEVVLATDRMAAQIRGSHAMVRHVLTIGLAVLLLLALGALRVPFHALRKLGRVAERIGDGDLSVRVPVRGQDEIASFCATFNSMVDGLESAREERDRGHLQTIQAMVGAVEAKDAYTQGHCIRVMRNARRIATRLEAVSEDLLPRLETAALLHDLGKIGVPDRVLLKEGPLDDEEHRAIRAHVTIGEQILSHVDSLEPIARWVRHHHERWDGLGYPDGLRERAIPIASRVIAVADAIDAMMTDRPYRRALTAEETARRLREASGEQFDPLVVEVAVAALEADALLHDVEAVPADPPA